MKVLLADDHEIVREGLKQVLKRLPGIDQVEESTDGMETFVKINTNKYDLIILDLSMPGLTGLEILQKLKDKNDKAPILVLSVHPHEQYAKRVFNLGASGYLTKNSAVKELSAAIRKISQGGKYISAELAEKLIFEIHDDFDKQPHENLSERELQILLLLAKGVSVVEIAEKLFISDRTVSTYRTRLLQKMKLKKNAELTQYAIKNKLIE